MIVGIDPDAEKHGVAMYRAGVLEELHMWSLVEIIDWLRDTEEKPVFAVEDIASNKFVYHRNVSLIPKKMASIGMSIGRAQQAQIELCRFLDAFAIPYHLFPPQKGNWAGRDTLFRKITGWKGRSNPDTRAAAFFGYLLASKNAAHRKKDEDRY